VTSTGVRKALDLGDVESAASILGRHFTLIGLVVKGAGRGRTLGFPTTNLDVPAGSAIPGDGIYATWARTGDRCYMAATSIGTRPTFDENERTIESFLLDFEDDLYGQEVRLEFVQRLRDELKYTSVGALVEQIDRDVEQVRTVLQAGGRTAG
jgi:riboflavin kinase/FMN adenylyltransferase